LVSVWYNGGMTHSDESLIEYPCDFPIKAMGLATDAIEAIFTDIVRRNLPHQQTFEIKRRDSKNGKYISITIILKAENREQLDAVYRELSAHEKILMTL
jgi:putative lipoic acid-binding regulatory protein